MQSAAMALRPHERPREALGVAGNSGPIAARTVRDAGGMVDLRSLSLHEVLACWARLSVGCSICNRSKSRS
jgi:hypothetical protein